MFSFSRRSWGTRSGKLYSSWSLMLISDLTMESMLPMADHPYGFQTSIPLIGYLLSTRSAISTMAGYQALKSSLGGMPLFALP